MIPRRAATRPGFATAWFVGAIAIAALGWAALVFAPEPLRVFVVALVFSMLIPGVFVVTAVRRTVLVWRAAHWAEARGRITRSQLIGQRQRKVGAATTVSNVLAIEYEFEVRGQKHRGRRVRVEGDAADSPEIEVALNRYPAGTVACVYHDPENPRDCALERAGPGNLLALWATALLLSATAVAIAVAAVRWESVDAWLAARFPHDAASPYGALFFAAMGLLIVALLASHRRSASAAARWPVVAGRVVSSEVESFDKHVGGAQRGARVTVHEAVVEYAYVVQGREYHGTRVSFGNADTGSQAAARAQAARYPTGSSVTVRYDASNPSSAVLEPSVARAGFWLVVAVASFAAAAFLGGFIG